MKRADGNGDVRMSIGARVFGLRVVEQSDDHVVVRLPVWFPRQWIAEACRRLAEHSAILDSGAGLSYRCAGRLIRVERAAKART